MLALFRDASLTPCFWAIPPSVSPDLTLYFPGLPLLDDLFELADELLAPGIVKVCPTRIVEPFILFAFLIDVALTPCLCAITPRVSPDLTLYLNRSTTAG